MRVIAGEAKGRRLDAPRGGGVRPMTDQIREAVFSSLASLVAGASVLDLYAGSGAVGIEALSRGAANATLVERDPLARETIRRNLEVTGLSSAARLYEGDVESFLQSLDDDYDLVFVDPPFTDGVPTSFLELLAGKIGAGQETVVILRVASRLMPVQVPEVFEVSSSRRYGDSTVLYLRRA